MSEHTEEWYEAAAYATAPALDWFAFHSTPSRDAQLLAVEFCAACRWPGLLAYARETGRISPQLTADVTRERYSAPRYGTAQR